MKTNLFSLFILYAMGTSAQHWSPLGYGLNKDVYTLFSDSSNNLLYAGGFFTKASGIKAAEIAVWNGAKWDSLGSGTGTGTHIGTITKFNNQIYSVGEFQHTAISYLARWNGVQWDTITKANGVNAIKAIGNFLYVVGVFDSIAGIPASDIAKWDGTNWSAIDSTHWQPAAIYNITSYKGDIYVTGNFSNYNNTIHQIARWDGIKWQAVGGGFQGGVSWGECFEIFNNELFVGGIFRKSDGNPGNGIAAWDGTAWHDIGGGITCCASADISCMLTFNGSLYVVGSFTDMSGVPSKFISKWDGTRWCGLGGVFANATTSLANYNGQLIIGGGFLNIDGDTLDCKVAAWTGGAYTDTCGFSVSVHEYPAISSFQSKLFPNPNYGQMTLQYDLPSGEEGALSIYDVCGKLVAEYKLPTDENILVLNEQDLREGIYFCRYTCNGKQIALTTKLVILK